MVARTVLLVVVAIVISWLEFLLGVAKTAFLGIEVVLWTDLVLLLVWVAGMVPLMLLRASNTYVLRNDSLEIRVGIVSSKSSIIAPSGFSDLEVTRSVSGRIMNVGNIVIRIQSEDRREVEMEKVRDPLRVADRIREVMARPVVRIEAQPPIRAET